MIANYDDIILTIQLTREQYKQYIEKSNIKPKPKIKIKINKPNTPVLVGNTESINKQCTVNINKNTTITDPNIITKFNFDQLFQYTKTDISTIRPNVKPNTRLSSLADDEILELSNLDTTTFKGTYRIKTPKAGRKLISKELRLLSNNLNNILCYAHAIEQIWPGKYDYAAIKYDLYQQYMKNKTNSLII